jgi:3-dehydroquinate synthetase
VQAASQIIAALDLPVHRSDVSLVSSAGTDAPSPAEVPRGRYGISTVDIGRGVLATLGQRLCDVGLATRAFLLMPKNLQDLYLEQAAASLDDASVPYAVITIEDGDSAKHLRQTREILDGMVENGAKRDSAVIPIGGGVTGDIGGFAASLFMRGIPLVQVPTTLLAQVDSSIGAKVGVNHPRAKNIIGSFYQPHLVLIDPCTLRTLAFEEISNGMAEVIKSDRLAPVLRVSRVTNLN